MLTRHQQVKVLPDLFEAIAVGALSALPLLDTTAFAVGDTVTLEEWDPARRRGFESTGRALKVLVTYVIPGGRYGIDKYYAVVAFKEIREDA